MTDPQAFWRGRRVFLTGHTGFKGSWLALWLHRLGAKVTGYSLAPPTEPNLFTLAGVETLLESHIADVRDLAALEAAMRAAAPSVVFHLASQPLLRKGLREPVDTYATNVMGTVNLLESARKTSGIGAVVVVTSDKCYANEEQPHGLREDEPMGGPDPYSSSKGCAELVTAAYRSSYFGDDGTAHVASARAGNVIGGGDWSEDRIVPDIVRAYHSGESLKLRSPNAVRPWQHVLDALSGYLRLAELLHGDRAYAEAWNFGPDPKDAVTVAQLTDRMLSGLGGNMKWELDGRGAAHEAGALTLDSSKAQYRLGWRPRLSCERAVEWAAEWYRCWNENRAMREATLDQIERFAK